MHTLTPLHKKAFLCANSAGLFYHWDAPSCLLSPMYSCMIQTLYCHSQLSLKRHFCVAELKITPGCVCQWSAPSYILFEYDFASSGVFRMTVCPQQKAVIEWQRAKTAELLLARCCGRLLKALTHFQVSPSSPLLTQTRCILKQLVYNLLSCSEALHADTGEHGVCLSNKKIVSLCCNGMCVAVSTGLQ